MGFLSILMGSRLGKLVATLVAAMGVLVGAVMFGKRAEREAQRVDDLEDYVETKKEIDDVEASDDRDAAFKRLRDNGWLR